jgi:transposase
MARLHAMIAGLLADADPDEVQVLVGIETDRGPWVAALAAAGYEVFAVNPLQAAQYRKRHAVSGAKSDAADAHVLADMVRTDAHQLRPVAGDSAPAQAVKVVARTHKTLIWERTRTTQRLRHALREYFPAAQQPLLATMAPTSRNGRVGDWRGFRRLRPRFQSPPVKPCMRFSRTRLTDVLHRGHSAFPAPGPEGPGRDDGSIKDDQAQVVRGEQHLFDAPSPAVASVALLGQP